LHREDELGYARRVLNLAVGVLVCAALVGCKKEGPCGRDAKVDTRPLPPAWAERWAMPKGTTACVFADDQHGDVQRHYSVPTDSTKAAVEAWDREWTAKGWVKQPPAKESLDVAIANSCSHGASYLHPDGYFMGFSVSDCADDNKGWSTIIFRPATKAERAGAR
jgi:hypothetical protein